MAHGDLRSFAANGNHVTVNLVVTPVSAALQYDGFNPVTVGNLTPGVITPNIRGRTVRLVNIGPATVFIEFVGTQGDRTATAATGIPMPPNTTEKFSTNGCSYVAAITASGTATLYATSGEGGF